MLLRRPHQPVGLGQNVGQSIGSVSDLGEDFCVPCPTRVVHHIWTIGAFTQSVLVLIDICGEYGFQRCIGSAPHAKGATERPVLTLFEREVRQTLLATWL